MEVGKVVLGWGVWEEAVQAGEEAGTSERHSTYPSLLHGPTGLLGLAAVIYQEVFSG